MKTKDSIKKLNLSGYPNSVLKKLTIGEILKVVGKIEKQEGRKVYITGKLVNQNDEIYVEMNGISIAGVNLSEENDLIAKRTWTKTENKIIC